ncbi:hypothetical protein P8452_34411 [Trifolium repens]|nr:hypothetical protein P8452_34411 [Trifolium repens]
MEDIEERENGGTPPIIQTMRAALAFWVKEYIYYEEIEKREQLYINKALKRLMPNPNIEILGNLSTKRQAILSFVIFYTLVALLLQVATLLNDVFGESKGIYDIKPTNKTAPTCTTLNQCLAQVLWVQLLYQIKLVGVILVE